MKSVYRVPHFWIILAIMVFGALIYYADRIPLIQTIVPQAPIELARYSTYRILSIIPVAYAAFVFGLRGGVITAVFISMALLPRALFFSTQVSEAVTETVAFFFMGLLVSWLIHRQQRAVHQLEKAQQELQANVQVIKENERRLAALNQISSTVSESLELSHVLSSAIDNVVDVMQADVAWIFLLDEKTSELSLAAHRGTPKSLPRAWIESSWERASTAGWPSRGNLCLWRMPLKTPGSPGKWSASLNCAPRLSCLSVPKGRSTAHYVSPCTATASFSRRKSNCLPPSAIRLVWLLRMRTFINSSRLPRNNCGYRRSATEVSLKIPVMPFLSVPTAARIISVNRACEQLTGYTQKELTSIAIYELFPGVSQDKVRQLFSEKLERVTVGGTEEVRLTRKNGTEAFIELKISPLLRGNEVIGLQVIAQDVTEEKQLRQNMEYYIKQVTRAQEDERLRISRELHDDTAQALATLSRDLDSLITGEKKLVKPVIAAPGKAA